MGYYKKHVFFCVNQRTNGKKCCADAGARAMRDFAKEHVRQLGLKDVRVNQAGCLGRCAEGPILVIYPEGIWYTYHNQADVGEIITEHLQNGRMVERLLLPDGVQR
jgi:(2Fe-2S) ferredoxin